MKTTRKKEWFDKESFWRELYPFMFSDQRMAEADDQVAKVLALTKPPGKSVLDLCCGPGRCSIALAKRSFFVTGVDKTKYLLDKARAKAKAAHVKIEWVQQDMRDFVRPDSFALVISMFTSFGYFDDTREDAIVLENMFTSLKPGGVSLIEVLGKERLAKILQPTSSTTLSDGSILVERREIYDDWTRVRNEWLWIRNGKAKSFKFHTTIYSGLELRDRLQHAGFVDVTLHGNLDGDEYGPNAERLVAVGHKPISRHAEKRQAPPSGDTR